MHGIEPRLAAERIRTAQTIAEGAGLRGDRKAWFRQGPACHHGQEDPSRQDVAAPPGRDHFAGGGPDRRVVHLLFVALSIKSNALAASRSLSSRAGRTLELFMTSVLVGAAGLTFLLPPAGRWWLVLADPRRRGESFLAV